MNRDNPWINARSVNGGLRGHVSMTDAQYGSAIERCKRAARRVPDAWKGYAAAILIGAALGALLAARG